MYVVEILGPIILVMALGTALRASRFATEEFFTQTNRLVYWIGLPSLLFLKTATARPELGAAASILAVLLIGMAACIAAGYLVGWRMGLGRAPLASFVQGAYRSNLAYVGLPIVLYALAAAGKDTPQAESLALLAIAPLVPVYNVVAVVVLQAGGGNSMGTRRLDRRELARGIATNPLIISCALGVLFAYTGLTLPLFIQRTLDAIGQMALPLALLAIGATLRLDAVRAGGRAATVSALIKVAFAPLAGLLAARLMGLEIVQAEIALLYLAMPTAVASYVMAERLGADSMLSSSIVALSTILAPLSLSIILVAAG